MKNRTGPVALALIVLLAHIAPAQERQTAAVVGAFQGYHFARALGVSSASLAILPVGYEVTLSPAVSFDLYTAYARGQVNAGDRSFTLQGVVDTRIRASLTVAPWAVVTAALNLPTGNATHDSEEAVVASALSTELLAFREALWGTGFGATTGIATAWRSGSTAIGLGASYRVASEFEPSADTAFKYTPGNEVRVRAAVDRDLGGNKLTAGVTYQNYSDDRVDGHDLFAPGNRWRADLMYSFRLGAASTWTVFATDVLRANGDVSLQIVDASGNLLRDTTFAAGQQNLAVLGGMGALRLGPTTSLRPAAELRVMTRKSGEGEGWLAALGTDLPIRRGSVDWIPSIRISRGAMEDASDRRHAFWGGEFSLTLRWLSR